MIDVKTGNDYTIVELKEFLRLRGLSANGHKAELISRLEGVNPDIWSELNRENEGTSEEVSDAGDEDMAGNRTVNTVVGGTDVNYELELIRRERDLLRRELALARRENEVASRDPISARSSPISENSVASIGSIKGMVSEFDGTGNGFWKWKQQIDLLRTTYNLDDNATKLLISCKLRDKAMNWFHSKAEHITLSATDLLLRMKQMFDHRPRKLTLKKDFENRTWQSEELFSEYYHDKVILANQVPIDEDEILDYIIEGVPDQQLRDQAYLQCFDEASKLLKAFEKISLKGGPKKSPEKDYRIKKEVKPDKGNRTDVLHTQRGQLRCFNCNGKGHRSSECSKPRAKAACFKCGSTDHRISDCPQRKNKTDNSTNLIQPVDVSEPYMVPVRYEISDNEGNICNYSVNAMVDTGSPVSLIKTTYVPDNCRAPVNDDRTFFGVNSSPLELLGIFEKNVKINNIEMRIKFLVVPNETMTCVALLGRDFTSHPAVKVIVHKTLEIAENIPDSTVDESVSFVNQIMHVDYCSESPKKSESLNIDTRVNHDDADKVREMFEDIYVTPVESEISPCEAEMSIKLKHEQPISSRARRLAHADKEKLRDILEQLSDEGIIRESNSPYASPIVLIRKKDGNLRLCIDYRNLNQITIQDNFPTPLIDDHLDQLRNKKVYSSLDLKNGFYHVKMASSSVKYTSFVTPLGQYEFLRMPFGLTNAPRVFQRYVHDVFRVLTAKNKVLIYMDDILIATETVDEHLNILREVFDTARRHKLEFRLDKCFFLYDTITYLGYTIDENGIRPSEKNVESVINYPVPKNSKEVQRFIGLASYFRRFIPKFSIIAKPLYDILKKDVKYSFGADEHKAFESLKRYLSDKPILAIYSPKAETELHCDASASGFGAILLQRQNGKLFQPVSYFSHRTTPTESKYHSFELECLAAIYAIKRFHVYLSGIRFKLVTDCDSFRLTLSKQTINPRIARWAMLLQEYDYEIVHRPGKRMTHVDALSRCHSVLILEASTFEQTLSIKQDQDPVICRIRDELEKSESKLYELRDGLVYRKIDKRKLLFYVPKTMENNVIRTSHDDLGHVGLNKVIDNVSKVYWFPNMRQKVRDYIHNCLKCIEFSSPSGKPEGLLHCIPKGNLPFQTCHIDHYGPLEKTGRGYRYLFSIVDAFTKFIRLYPCKSTTSSESIKHLRDYFRSYSKPQRVVSDRGTAFTSETFKDFVKEESVNHVLIAVGTPRANGQVERFNRMITPMLAKLCEIPTKWDQVVSLVEYAINNTICRSTGNSPSKLLFGIEQIGQINDNLRLILDRYTEEDRDLLTIRKVAAENIVKNQSVSEKSYNRTHKSATTYNVGDYIVIKNIDTTAGVNKKLIPKYKGPYVVRKVLNTDRYVISDIDGFQITQLPYNGIVSPDHMKHWVRDY